MLNQSPLDSDIWPCRHLSLNNSNTPSIIDIYAQGFSLFPPPSLVNVIVCPRKTLPQWTIVYLTPLRLPVALGDVERYPPRGGAGNRSHIPIPIEDARREDLCLCVSLMTVLIAFSTTK